MVICLERVADLHMSQLMPLPLTVSCFSKIQIGFTFLVPDYPISPGKRAVKCVCVCVCVGSPDGPAKWSFREHFFLVLREHFLYTSVQCCTLRNVSLNSSQSHICAKNGHTFANLVLPSKVPVK